MSKPISINNFSKHLFWDVDLNSFDFKEHKSFLIEMVLEYGKLQDWNLLKELYGKEEIKNTALTIRSLDPVTLSFLCAIFNLKETEFRCYKQKQLVPNVWNS